MPVRIALSFDRRHWGNPAVQRAAWNAAKFIRDLWLAKAPHVSGDYTRGLSRPGSVIVKPGEIVVENLSLHAHWYEHGTRAFNWGLRTLQKGNRVHISKDGNRYKYVKVEPRGRVAFRKATVAEAVIAAFRNTIPRGRTKFATFSGMARYSPMGRLAKPIRPRKPLAGSMSGVFTVSERSIRKNPKLWYHEAVPGKHLAAEVRREAEPIVRRALEQAMAAEAAKRARARRRR